MPIEKIKPEPMKKIKGQPHLLAYITPNEVEKLKALGGQETMTKEGIPAYPEYDNYGFSSQADFDSGDVSKSNDPNVQGTGSNFDGTPQKRVTAAQLAAINKAEKEAAKIAQRKLDKQKAKNKNITKFGYAKPKNKFSGILGTIAGMMLGIPGLGLLTSGLGSLKDKFNDVTNNPNDLSLREKLTGFKTQKEYEDARTQRQLQGRLDDMYDRKSKGKGFSQKNMDMLESMGLSPSTAQNVLTGRDLKGFTESRMGLQTPQTFSDPFANTVGTTTKVNAPASDAISSTVPQGIAFNNPVGGLDQYAREMEALEAAKAGETLKPNQLGGTLQDFYTNKQPLSSNESLQVIDDNINFNTQQQGINSIDVGYPSNDLMADALTTPTEGAYGFNLMELDRLKKAGYDPKELSTYPNQDDVQSIIRNLEPSGYTDADFTNEYGYPMTAGLLDNIGVKPAIKTKDTGLGYSIPTGDVGLNASGKLGSLSGTVNAIDALKGESVNPEFNYSGNFGNTNVYGNYSDDAQNIGLNFNNDKGLSGGISYDAITGEPRFDIGFRRTFADGGIASMFTRRG